MSDSPFEGEASNPVEEHVAGPSPGGNVLERLFDGSAQGPAVTQIESDYGLAREISISLRGIMRIADGDGVPPIAEILLGVVLYVLSQQSGGDAGDELAGLEDIA